jgi:hypothetical protein
MKRFLSWVLIFVFVFVALDVSVEASQVTDIGKARYYVEKVIKETELPYGVKQHTDISFSSAAAGEVSTMGTGITAPFVANKYYQQQVNVLEVPSNENIKVTPWAYISQGQWNLRTVRVMAKDYEEKNPGFRVIAAINADFFDINANNMFPRTPSGAHASGGENYKTVSGRAVGFTNNGTTKSLIGNQTPGRSQLMKLALYDANNQIVKEYDINKVNTVPSDNQIAIYYPKWALEAGWATQKLLPINVQDAFIVNDGEYSLPISNVKAVVGNKSDNADFYGRGVITSFGSAELSTGDFAIISNNPEVTAALKVGMKIRAQYEFTGAFADVNEVVGVGNTILYNGEMTGTDTARHPRTMVGVKADGTLLMTVVDGRQQSKNMYGASQAEMAAILKHYGAVEGYNLDGGGSSTMIILNDGQLEVTNSPSDGNERTDSNCLLIVMRVPTISYKVSKIASSSITIDADVTDYNGITFTDLYVKMNGVYKLVENKKAEFNSLDPNKQYSYEFFYKDGQEYKSLVVADRATTAKREPVLSIVKIYFDGDDIIFDVGLDDPDNALTRRSVSIGGVSTTISNGKAKFVKFEGDIFNDIKIILAYDLNDGKGRIDLESTDFQTSCGLEVLISTTLYQFNESLKGIYR